MGLAPEGNMRCWYRLFCIVLPKDGLFWPSPFARPVSLFSYVVCLFLSLILASFPHFYNSPRCISLHSHSSYLSNLSIFSFCPNGLHYFPVFCLTSHCCQPPVQLSGLCYCSLSAVSSCLCQASAGLPLYQLHVGWVSAHPVLIQIIPDLTLPFHPFFSP